MMRGVDANERVEARAKVRSWESVDEGELMKKSRKEDTTGRLWRLRHGCDRPVRTSGLGAPCDSWYSDGDTR